jgi:hypothetical protein
MGAVVLQTIFTEVLLSHQICLAMHYGSLSFDMIDMKYLP